jgi:cyclophilin family peptidyl-prolyl cis-trans isomerase
MDMRTIKSFQTAYGPLGLLLTEVSSSQPGTDGDLAAGDEVLLIYVGRLDSFDDGKIFDQRSADNPLSVRVGRAEVIVGLDAALPYLRVGQKVRLTIPAALAYGAKGKPGAVPPESTLFFELEVHARAPDSPGARALDAASIGDTPVLQRLLALGSRVHEYADRKGATALHVAASAGHLECVVWLLEAGAHVDAVQSQPAGVTPLMLAAKHCADPFIFKLLLCARADASKASAKGNTAASILAAESKQAGGAAAELLAALSPTVPSAAAAAAELGVPQPAGFGAEWEAVRNAALWHARQRADNPRVFMRLVVAPAEGRGSGAAGGACTNDGGYDPRGQGGHPRDTINSIEGELAGQAGAEMEEARRRRYAQEGVGWHLEAASVPRVEMELFADVVPRMAENFRALCTGEQGRCQAFGAPPLCYLGNRCHRIVRGQILQGGDITTLDGRGGESIYGRSFADESFGGRAGRHRSKGLLSMANSGRNSNGSQFFLTLDAMPHLDGKHVVFGKVVRGMEFVEAVVAAVATPAGTPSWHVVIADCGECAKPYR